MPHGQCNSKFYIESSVFHRSLSHIVKKKMNLKINKGICDVANGDPFHDFTIADCDWWLICKVPVTVSILLFVELGIITETKCFWWKKMEGNIFNWFIINSHNYLRKARICSLKKLEQIHSFYLKRNINSLFWEPDMRDYCPEIQIFYLSPKYHVLIW